MDALIVLNFKTYGEATGVNALNLAKVCDEIARETDAKIVVVPQHADLYRVSSEVDIPVYAQHIDDIKYGSYTGHVLAESVKEAGASGCLLNHSENRIRLADMEACVGKLRSLGLTSIVCANNINTTKAAAALNPDFVAVEPPELIGSGISVSQTRPEVVSGSVEAVKKINPQVRILCGAGITNAGDVKKAVELGTEGVLLASGVVKAADPKAVLRDLVNGSR